MVSSEDFVDNSSNGRCFFGAGAVTLGALFPIGRKRRFGDFLPDGNRGGIKGVVEAPTVVGAIVSVGSWMACAVFYLILHNRRMAEVR